jgi:glycogen(starch) synthase
LNRMTKRGRFRGERIRRDVFLTGRYQSHFNPEDRNNPFFKIYDRKKQDALKIIGQSKPSARILDVGGGYGRLSLALAPSVGSQVVLADISRDMLARAAAGAQGLARLNILNADAHHLPFRDDTFDIIVGLDLFCHLEAPARAVSEFRRVLKPGGLLILDSTNSNPLWSFFYPRYLGKNPLDWLKILRFHGVYPGWEGIVRHYPRERFFSLLQEGGFRIIRHIEYGPRICPKWHLAVSRKVA